MSSEKQLAIEQRHHWICTLPTETCLIIVTSLKNYEWKCKNNDVSMKSNYLICRTQHHISIWNCKKVHDPNRKFTHRSLLAPCLKGKKAQSTVGKHGCALCKKTAVTKLTFIPKMAIFRSLQPDRIKTWNFKLEKNNYERNPMLLLSLLLTKHWF